MKAIFALVVAGVATAAIVSLTIIPHPNVDTCLDVNNGVILLENYSLADTDLDSQTCGSFIVYEVGDEVFVKIVGTLHIDETDFAGVGIYSEAALECQSVVTSYRDDLKGNTVEVYEVQTQLPFHGGTAVTIGRTSPGDLGGGEGVFEITYKYCGSKLDDTNSLSFFIEVASFYVDGHPAIGHVSSYYTLRL